MKMTAYNQTLFTLAGFSFGPSWKICELIVLFTVYSLSVLGNILIITVTSLEQHLQTPMYFFLSSLGALDIIFISSTVPKLMEVLASGNKVITFNGCLLQLYFYVSSGGTEFYTLGLLSFDRYTAICHPLRYNTILTNQLCWKLAVASWIFGFLEFIPAILFMSHLEWCNTYNIIDHFFCDGSALLRLSCSDTKVAEKMFFTFASFSILSSLISCLLSYYFILSSILRIALSSARSKTFSTCSSHFIAVLIAYGSCIFIYVLPAGSISSSPRKTMAIFNSILGPLVHPFIYSLRNKIVRTSIRHMFRINKTFNSQWHSNGAKVRTNPSFGKCVCRTQNFTN